MISYYFKILIFLQFLLFSCRNESTPQLNLSENNNSDYIVNLIKDKRLLVNNPSYPYTIYNIGSVNGRAINQKSALTVSGSKLQFEGWAINKSLENCRVSGYLTVGDKYFELEINKESSHVNKYLKSDNYNKCGWSITIDKSKLNKGRNTLNLILFDNNNKPFRINSLAQKYINII